MGQYLLTLLVQVTSITKDMILEGIYGNYPAYIAIGPCSI